MLTDALRWTRASSRLKLLVRYHRWVRAKPSVGSQWRWLQQWSTWRVAVDVKFSPFYVSEQRTLGRATDSLLLVTSAHFLIGDITVPQLLRNSLQIREKKSSADRQQRWRDGHAQ